MENIKLSNRLDCIIRGIAPGHIGNTELSYGNQPYTIIRDVAVTFSFSSVDSSYNAQYKVLGHRLDNVSSVSIGGVKTTQKILEMVFGSAEGLLTKVVSTKISNSKIYISAPSFPIYQVFVFDKSGNLIAAADRLDSPAMTLDRIPDEVVQVFFSYPARQSFSFDEHPQWMYFTLDFAGEVNLSDKTSYTTIHLDKCLLRTNRNLIFNADANTIDLEFDVIHDRSMKNADYIAF